MSAVIHPIRCCFKSPACVGQIGTVEFPDDREYPGDDFYGMICDGCKPTYRAQLDAEEEAARVALAQARAEALARLNAGQATIEDVRLLMGGA